GYGNTVVGKDALIANTSGHSNTAIGTNALGNPFVENVGDLNTAIGFSALGSNISGSSNIALGAGAGDQVSTASNVICIGTSGANTSNSCYIGNIRDALVDPDAQQVWVDSAGKLGTFLYSSRRFKTQIQPMDRLSESILSLKPVTFRYKNDQ